jgi:hypothetical protein
MNSNRYGESRAAYREVQERHEDIKRIERTIAELAQLFNDVRLSVHVWLPAWPYLDRQMSILVEQQDETINIIEAQASEVEKDVETGWGRFLDCLDHLWLITFAALAIRKRLSPLQDLHAKSVGFASSYSSSSWLSLALS